MPTVKRPELPEGKEFEEYVSAFFNPVDTTLKETSRKRSWRDPFVIVGDLVTAIRMLLGK